MFSLLRKSLVVTLMLATILCGIYPLLVTSIGMFFFPDKVRGGLVHFENGNLIGAKLIGQTFTRPEYFHGRPSAAGPRGYDAGNSAGSNLGPTNQKFYDVIAANIQAVLRENPNLKKGEIPVDLVTASGSGLDPHISPAAAFAQVQRVSQARQIPVESIYSLINESIEGPQLGFLGEPVVNVLMLNMKLEKGLVPVARISKLDN